LPYLFIRFLGVFPEGRRQKIGWERFDEYPLIIPYEMKMGVLSNDNAAASGGLEVERGDVSIRWRKGLG
jgi:hypothetical protein